MEDKRIERIRRSIRDVPNFPKPGILFRDITPLLADVKAFQACLDLFIERFPGPEIDAIIGIESRGFIFAAALAAKLRKPFVMVRKPKKLPWKTYRAEYRLEYGKDAIEIHQDAIAAGARVLIVDDLLATGGTAEAAIDLVGKLQGKVVGAAFAIELLSLKGADKLKPVETFSLVKY
jgi:adenine phosphoribosyltransferase